MIDERISTNYKIFKQQFFSFTLFSTFFFTYFIIIFLSFFCYIFTRRFVSNGKLILLGFLFFSSSSSSWDQASLISILIWGETNNEIESIGGKWREKWRDFVLSRIILCFFIIKNFYLCQRLTISQRQIFSHSTNWKLVYDCELNDHWRLT